MFHIPESAYVVQAIAPQVGAAGLVVGDYISLKNLHKVFIVIHYDQGDAEDITWTPMRATAVAPVGNVVIATAVPIWSNLACATTDVLTRRTDAVNYASGVDQTNKIVIFAIDPRTLGDTYDCLGITHTNNIEATSYVSAVYVCVPRYAGPSDDWQTVITD